MRATDKQMEANSVLIRFKSRKIIEITGILVIEQDIAKKYFRDSIFPFSPISFSKSKKFPNIKAMAKGNKTPKNPVKSERF